MNYRTSVLESVIRVLKARGTKAVHAVHGTPCSSRFRVLLASTTTKTELKGPLFRACSARLFLTSTQEGGVPKEMLPY